MQRFIFSIIGILVGLFLYIIYLKIFPNLGSGLIENIVAIGIAILLRIKFAHIEKVKYGSLGMIIFNSFMIIIWVVFSLLLVTSPLK